MVTASDISAVMSALGKRNKGKPKAMTPAARLQRKLAGIASAKARGFTPRAKSRSLPRSDASHPPRGGQSVLWRPKRNGKGTPEID